MDTDALEKKAKAFANRFPNSVKTLPELHDKTPPERDWLWPEVIPAEVVVTLGGPPGAGKSLLAQQICMAIASGADLFGESVTPRATLYITCEDSEEEVWRRAIAIQKCLEISTHDLTDFFFDSWLSDPDTLLVNGTKLDQLKSFVTANHIKLLVLDLLPDYWAGNEIMRAEVNHFMKGVLGAFACETKCTVMGLHHPSKAGMADGSGTSGSTGMEGSVRQRLYLTGEDPNKIRTLEVKKSNQGKKGPIANLEWQRFTDQAGAFVVTDQLRQGKQRELGKHEKPFLEAIPKEGISTSSHRALFSDRRAYFKSKTNLLEAGLITVEEDIFHSRDVSQRRLKDSVDV